MNGTTPPLESNHPTQIQYPKDTIPRDRCFAHHHMSATQYGFWSVCRALASGSNGILYFSGPKLAERFLAMGKNTPYTLAKDLVANGWFKLVRHSARRPDGTRSPTVYRVLDHDEWVAEHPHCCNLPSLYEGMEPSQSEVMVASPSRFEGQPSQSEGLPSRFEGQPSQSEGTNLYKPTYRETTNKTTDILPPPQIEGMVFEVSELVGKFSKKGKHRPRTGVAGPKLPPQPSPETGMANSEVQAERLSAALTNSLGIKDSSRIVAWKESLRTVLDEGNQPELVRRVVDFAYDNLRPSLLGDGPNCGPSGFVSSFPQLAQAVERISAKK